jgi:hypothetical protein
MIVAFALSLLGMLQGPSMPLYGLSTPTYSPSTPLYAPGLLPIVRDCKLRDCSDADDARDQGLPDQFLDDLVDDNTPRRRRWGGGGSGPPPTSCTPFDPRPPKPDIAAMPLPEGRIVHEAGDGAVVTGMETEFRWEGPDEISWTQPGLPGLREDCSLVPGEPARFTARMRTLLFEFEEGDRKQYVANTGRVKHRYNETGRFTVCVYAGYETPGGEFATLVRAAELDHNVVEIRSTLIE